MLASVTSASTGHPRTSISTSAQLLGRAAPALPPPAALLPPAPGAAPSFASDTALATPHADAYSGGSPASARRALKRSNS
jgi:hypothetical protein